MQSPAPCALRMSGGKPGNLRTYITQVQIGDGWKYWSWLRSCTRLSCQSFLDPQQGREGVRLHNDLPHRQGGEQRHACCDGLLRAFVREVSGGWRKQSSWFLLTHTRLQSCLLLGGTLVGSGQGRRAGGRRRLISSVQPSQL